MGVRDLLEVMRADALNRFKEEKKKRKESLKIRLLLPPKFKETRLERRGKLL